MSSQLLGWRFTIRFTDAGRTLATIGFDRIPSRYNFALGVPQSTTERVLIERLADRGGAVERELVAESLQTIPGGYQVSGHGADGTPFAVTARYVVGADGAHSMVRSAIGLDFPGETYQQQFLLADVALDGQPCADNEALICTSSRGVVVLGRMPSGNYRVIVTLPADGDLPQNRAGPRSGNCCGSEASPPSLLPSQCGRLASGCTTGPPPGSAPTACSCAGTPRMCTARPPARV